MKTAKHKQVVLMAAVALSLMSYVFLSKSQPTLFVGNCSNLQTETSCIEESTRSSSVLPDLEIITSIIGTISKFLPSS